MSISGALNAGYAAADILDLLSKGNPKAGKTIRKVLSAGYTASQVLKYISGNKGDDDSYLTSEQKTKRNYERNYRKALMHAGMAAAGITGLGYLALAGRGGAAAMSQAANAVGVPNVPGTVASGATQAASGLNRNAILQQAAQMGQSPQALPAIAQSAKESPTLDADLGTDFNFSESDFAKKYPHVTKFIEKHKESGKSEEETYDALKQSRLFGPIVNKFEEQTKAPFSEAIKQIYDQGGKYATPEASDMVITPFGAGNIHKEHGKDAYVEVDGKLRKVPKEELQPPEPDVVEAVNNILKIPEIDRSSNVALFLYDPSESKAIFQFHDGSAYKYLDIDPEIVRKISEKEATPITEGKNMYGAWSPDDPHGSLGAALWSYLLKDPKYAKSKKGEPANPNYMKLQTLYDYWEKLRKKKGKK